MTDAELQRIADELGEPIEIVRDMNDAIECCAREGESEALNDRRQNAREAFYDTIETTHADDAIASAIEVATRVKITTDVTEAFMAAPGDADDIATPLEAAFRAAGFEVVE